MRELDVVDAELNDLEQQIDTLQTRFPVRQFKMLGTLLLRIGVSQPVRVITRTVWTLSALTLVAMIAFAPGWPVLLLDLAGVWLCHFAFFAAARRTGRITLADVWLPLTLLLLLAGVSSGLGGHIPTVDRGEYHFNGELRALDGKYARLGETGNMVYLRRCVTGPSRLVGVRSDAIEMVIQPGRANVRTPASLWGVVFQGESVWFGFRHCEQEE